MVMTGYHNLFALLFSLVVMSGHICPSIANAQSDELDNPDTICVLFVGNSYTYVNNLPLLLSRMATSAEVPVTIETAECTGGGYTLEQHWNEGRAVNEIRKGWDFVVLQEQSMRPV